jgi:hypothetical protein
VLAELIDSLSASFCDYLGGPQNHVILLPLLESLCKVEEPNVRDKARAVPYLPASSLGSANDQENLQLTAGRTEEIGRTYHGVAETAFRERALFIEERSGLVGSLSDCHGVVYRLERVDSSVSEDDLGPNSFSEKVRFSQLQGII